MLALLSQLCLTFNIQLVSRKNLTNEAPDVTASCSFSARRFQGIERSSEPCGSSKKGFNLWCKVCFKTMLWRRDWISHLCNTHILYVTQSHVRGLVLLSLRFELCMSQHTQMEISMLTKLNLAHRIEEHPVQNSALIVSFQPPISGATDHKECKNIISLIWFLWLPIRLCACIFHIRLFACHE